MAQMLSNMISEPNHEPSSPPPPPAAAAPRAVWL